MNNFQVAKNFSNHYEKSKGSNFFIEEGVLYSYGYHFIVAKHTSHTYQDKPIVYFNYNDFSPSTQRQKSHARTALLPDFYLLEVDNPSDVKESDVKLHTDEIEYYKEKLSRARVEHTKNYYNDMIEYHTEQKTVLSRILGVNTQDQTIIE